MDEIPADLFELSDADLAALRPLVVPATYGALGNFPAPLIPLAASELALTWVALTPPEWMLYVKPAAAVNWQQRGIDLYVRALANLREADAGRTWTHEKRDEVGRLIWVGMMHDDGLGSSRLLCFEELSAAFPHGYLVALPDRSCGLAVSAGANNAERREFDDMVEHCFAGATTPMSDQIMAPEALRPRLT